MRDLSLFIIGMPRSGTKLLRNLLNNNDNIFIPNVETVFIPKILKRFGNKSLSQDDILRLCSIIENSMFFHRYPKKLDIDLSQLIKPGNTASETIELFYNILSFSEKREATILGDKSPNYINDIELLLNHFPKAKFIHIIRDPRDYALSINKAWGKNIYRAVFRWHRSVSNFQYQSEINKGRVFTVKYEDLISQPVESLKEVCYFLNIEYQSGMHKLNEAVEKVGDARSSAIKSDNKKKYLTELSIKEIENIEKITYPTITKFYKLDSDIHTNKKPLRVMRMKWFAQDVFNLLIGYIKRYGLRKGITNMKRMYDSSN